jgi:hypothetical protein
MENLFLNNKYTHIYNLIIFRAINRSLVGYSEKHHIVPKSLGGSNRKDNLVKLTAREHFICHRLLVKMTTGQNKIKMSYAIRCMVLQENQHQERYKINSMTYEYIMMETKPVISNRMKGKNNPFYNKKHSKETQQKMREKRALQVMPTREGKVYSDTSLTKWREGNKKQFEDPWQKEIRRKINAEYRAKVGKTTGWHNPNTLEFKYFSLGKEPSGWVKGRVTKKKEVV